MKEIFASWNHKWQDKDEAVKFVKVSLQLKKWNFVNGSVVCDDVSWRWLKRKKLALVVNCCEWGDWGEEERKRERERWVTGVTSKNLRYKLRYSNHTDCVKEFAWTKEKICSKGGVLNEWIYCVNLLYDLLTAAVKLVCLAQGRLLGRKRGVHVGSLRVRETQ